MRFAAAGASSAIQVISLSPSLVWEQAEQHYGNEITVMRPPVLLPRGSRRVVPPYFIARERSQAHWRLMALFAAPHVLRVNLRFGHFIGGCAVAEVLIHFLAHQLGGKLEVAIVRIIA
jgi:hypothetical protein